MGEKIHFIFKKSLVDVTKLFCCSFMHFYQPILCYYHV